ncbi:MAG: hypothetical protein KC503_33535 [Myxococcales bacterium]|nr:hypothetical protein [Myxococcales bacterium]
MSLDRTPLDVSQLPPQVQRVCAPNVPGPARMMAARGLAPMGPKDLITALYQLGLDTDAKIAQAAKQTAAKLPENILAAALGEALDARVLDFFAEHAADKPLLAEKILLNRAAHDETMVAIARSLGEREVEILAGNAERIVRCPRIIEAIYFNKHARMSTVDRLLEFAVRNKLVLEGIPQFKAIAASILGEAAAEQPPQAQPQQPAAALVSALSLGDMSFDDEQMAAFDDDIFSQVLNDDSWDQGPVGTLEFEGEQDDENKQKISEMSVTKKIRLASIGSIFHRMVLVRDSNKAVAMAAIGSPGVGEQEAARYAANRGLSEEVIRFIANKKEWQKNYQIKVSLVNNPKTPLPSSLRLLKHLRPNDVKALARSKNIPAALANAAKQILSRKSGGPSGRRG